MKRTITLEPIPGSVQFRAYCMWCGEPMRVPHKTYTLEDGEDRFIFDCGCGSKPPPAHTGLTPRMRHHLSKTQ
jgi:hypothetical protein